MTPDEEIRELEITEAFAQLAARAQRDVEAAQERLNLILRAGLAAHSLVTGRVLEIRDTHPRRLVVAVPASNGAVTPQRTE